MQRREPRARVPDLADLREGTVTSVKAQTKDPNRVSVFLDEAFAFGLAADVAVAEGVRKGLRLTPEGQLALLIKEEVVRAKQAALEYLSRGSKTTAEVRRSLARRGFSDAAAEEALAKMEEYGYLDDAAYAVAFARSRAASSGHGPQRLRADLIKKGVSREGIERALDELDADDLADSARRLAAQRWRALAREEDPRKRKKKTTDFLLRRGFSFDQVRDAVEAAMEEEPDDGEPWE